MADRKPQTEEDDVTGDGQGGAGEADPSLVPRPNMAKMLAGRIRSTKATGSGTKKELFDGASPPIDDTQEPEVLANGYSIVRRGGQWILYDDNDKPLGGFTTRAAAVQRAYELKSPQDWKL